ncbi:MAG: hypothetical protein KKF88_03020 [Alphaproteobacteria bacterium]|nr:hypothetical protein [Alphaproteobacteria bacterium]
MWLLTSLGLILGVLHLTLTLPIYGRLSLEALWFAGSGLAVVCCTLMNVVALRSSAPPARWAVVIANLLMAGFFATAWTLMPSPQVAAGFTIFTLMAACFGPITVWQEKAAQRAASS